MVFILWWIDDWASDQVGTEKSQKTIGQALLSVSNKDVQVRIPLPHLRCIIKKLGPKK